MLITSNISLAEEQKGCLNSRREAGGFSSQSDVVRDLIRSEQERERETLLRRFREMEPDGSNDVEPASVLAMVKKVKKAPMRA